MVTCETLLFCLQKDTRQCCDALARFCVIRPVGGAGLPTSLVFAAMAYHVVEPCSAVKLLFSAVLFCLQKSQHIFPKLLVIWSFHDHSMTTTINNYELRLIPIG